MCSGVLALATERLTDNTCDQGYCDFSGSFGHRFQLRGLRELTKEKRARGQRHLSQAEGSRVRGGQGQGRSRGDLCSLGCDLHFLNNSPYLIAAPQLSALQRRPAEL